MITAIRKGELLQRVVVVLIGVIVLIYSFEGIWGTRDMRPYLYMAPIGAVLMITGVVCGRLYQNPDTCLIALFLALSWISTIFSLGLSADFLTSRFFCTFMIFLGMYFIIQIIPDPIKVFTCFSGIYTAGMSLMCLYVLAHASRFLLSEDPWVDMAKGCIKNGRLCGLNNANSMGIACASMIIVAMFGFINSGKKIKWFYVLGFLLGWFCLGLTGCRTGMIGASFVACLFAFIVFYKRLNSNSTNPNSISMTSNSIKTRSGVIKTVAVIIFSIAIFVIVLKSFLLPTYIYRIVMTGIAMITGRNWAIPAISDLIVREIGEDDGTLSDRTLIWASCIKQCTKTLRRFLLGISPLSRENIINIYEGRHDLKAPHSHNTYLELLRKHGLLGFITWMILVINWCVMGVKTLFSKKESMSVKYLCIGAAAILLMGMAEPVPFSTSLWCYSGIPFFMICGYCIRMRRRT